MFLKYNIDKIDDSGGIPVELKNLRTFQTIVDQGSYQKAADCLGYTQSTVTIHIQQLEEELGIPLFERTGRRMVLTQVGEQALSQARELLAAADRLHTAH